jgi:Mechanosensitive ion channel, conserved TM helix
MNTLERVFIEPFESFYEKVLQFLPSLLTSLLLLAVGIVLGRLLKVIFGKVLKTIKLDKFADKVGMMEVLRKGGIKEPLSVLLSRVIGWITVVIFVVISLRALQVPIVERLLERFLLYVPNVFVAASILFFGYVLSNFLGRAALIAAVNAGMKVSGLIGKLVQLSVFILAVTMSLEQLGIGSSAIIIAFAIVFGGIVLALAIAFGFGGRDIAREYLEKKMRGKGEEEEDEINHL